MVGIREGRARFAGAWLFVSSLMIGGVSTAATPEILDAQSAPTADVALAPSTAYTLRYVEGVPCAPKRRPVHHTHRPIRRAVRMTPIRAYTPVRHPTLSELMRKPRPVRCEVERRSPFLTPAVADATPIAATLLSVPVAPTGAISSLPSPDFQTSRIEGTGPAPFANVPPITGAGRGPFTRSISGAPVSAAPEPAAWVLLLAGLGSIGAVLRRRGAGIRKV